MVTIRSAIAQMTESTPQRASHALGMPLENERTAIRAQLMTESAMTAYASIHMIVYPSPSESSDSFNELVVLIIMLSVLHLTHSVQIPTIVRIAPASAAAMLTRSLKVLRFFFLLFAIVLLPFFCVVMYIL